MVRSRLLTHDVHPLRVYPFDNHPRRQSFAEVDVVQTKCGRIELKIRANGLRRKEFIYYEHKGNIIKTLAENRYFVVLIR